MVFEAEGTDGTVVIVEWCHRDITAQRGAVAITAALFADGRPLANPKSHTGFRIHRCIHYDRPGPKPAPSHSAILTGSERKKASKPNTYYRTNGGVTTRKGSK